MPTRTNSNGVFARRIAPFAPLAIGLLLSNAVITPRDGIRRDLGTATAVAVCDEVEDFRGCHEEYPTGCTKSERGHYDAYLNALKNAVKSSKWSKSGVEYLSLADFRKKDRAMPANLKKGNHEQFKTELAALGEGRLYGIVGYLYYAELMAEESSNCQLAGEPNADYHIGIGYNSATAKAIFDKVKFDKDELREMKRTSVIVEMTPHYREDIQPNWNIADIKAVRGRKVRVIGQLLIDNEHNIPSQNCALDGADEARCWRASAWELHPVTTFQVCGEADQKDCTETSGKWLELEKAVPPE